MKWGVPGHSAGLTVMYLQPPRDESLNGLLQGYRIYYRELESEASSVTASKTLKTPSALRAELTGESLPCPDSGMAGEGRGDPPGEECACSLRAGHGGDAARLQ